MNDQRRRSITRLAAILGNVAVVAAYVWVPDLPPQTSVAAIAGISGLGGYDVLEEWLRARRK